MKAIVVFASVITLTFQLQSQNLVPNPSFENVVNSFCGIMNTNDFNDSTADWFSPTAGSPDLYFTDIAQDCYNFQPESQYDGPIGIKGTQLPRNGMVMAGIGLYSIDGMNQREYLSIPLSNPMIPGKTYKVSYFVSFADFIEFSIEKIGIHFSTGPLETSTSAPLAVAPQLQTEITLTDTENWMLVTDLFTADLPYEYMTIGNFNSDNNTTVSSNPNATGAPGTYGAYYYFDDFTVEDIAPTSLKDLEDGGATLFPNPANEFIRISFESRIEDAVISIYNLQGQLMSTQTMKATNFVELNVSNFSTSTYIIYIQSESDIFISRFVKID